jgi:hypothetical protein
LRFRGKSGYKTAGPDRPPGPTPRKIWMSVHEFKEGLP